MTEKLTEKDYEVLDACCELLSIKIDKLKAENFELKESLKCFQTPEATKALTFYKTGEFELQEKKCIELEQENARLKEILQEIKGTCIYYREQMGIKKGSVTDFLAGEILDSIDKMEV